MKLLSASQIREWEKLTITLEPILSIDLMERASHCFVRWFEKKYYNTEIPITVICGNGNNGGDGLGIARLLRDRHYNVQVYIIRIIKEDSLDFDINLGRLMKYGDVNIEFLHDEIPVIQAESIIIDAMLGIGINRPVQGILRSIFVAINHLPNIVVSVDMPSGLVSEGKAEGDIIISDMIFTFQVPKLSFFLRENQKYCNEWVVGDIGLHKTYLDKIISNIFFVDHFYAKSLLKKRNRFQHKGDFGHALIVAGSEGKMGAAILASKACLRSGAGLVTALVPEVSKQSIQVAIPEAMLLSSGHFCFSSYTLGPVKHTIGLGPGIGTDAQTVKAMGHLLQNQTKPLVIDADSLNIISKHKEMWTMVPPQSIITPHPKEFDRLFGISDHDHARHNLAKTMAIKYKIFIVLKGAYSRIYTPDSKEMINSTGNPGMATAGSGDVLTGIITAFLAQKYDAEAAAVLGVYLHGLAGDLAVSDQSYESMIASDIIDHLGAAFQQMTQ